MKKIVFVLNDLACGGAQRVVLNLLENLNKNKFKVNLFLLYEKGAFHGQIPKECLVYFPKNTNRTVGKVVLLKHLVEFSKGADLIIGALELMPTYMAICASRICKCPCIGWVHTNLEVFLFMKKSRLKSIVHRFLIKIFYNKLDGVITVSDGAKESLKKYIKERNWSKIKVLKNPICIENIIRKSDSSVEFFPDGSNIITVGRLDKGKNIQMIIKAHASLINEGIKNHLVILGEGEEKKCLNDLINKLNVEKSVLFLGFKENPYPYMKKANVFVMTSLYEGLPTVLIEALALGIPIVSLDCPSGPGEILSNGEYGILLKTNEPRKVAEGIKRILYDKKLSENLSRKGKIRAEDFNITNVVKK